MKNNTLHLIIAPKNSRRAKFWIEVLEQNNLDYLQISYIDIIDDNFELDTNTQYKVRLESAGEDAETYRSIIHFGKSNLDSNIEKNEFGELSNFENWYFSWQKLLRKIKALERIYQFKFINEPLDIALAFNKKATQNLLIKSNIFCPEILIQSNYNDLINEMISKKIPQVFIKPVSGSSASGIIAFRYLTKEKQIAYTSIKQKDSKFYNSLKIQTYKTEKSIRKVFEAIETNTLQIEKWIPKWQFERKSVDFRVVVINNKVEFIVPRASKSPITNLHLGNEKLALAKLNLAPETIHRIKEIALQAMKCFPGLHYAGIDVLLSKNLKVYVLEINPFGDMLLNIVNQKNNTCYEQELESLE